MFSSSTQKKKKRKKRRKKDPHVAPSNRKKSKSETYKRTQKDNDNLSSKIPKREGVEREGKGSRFVSASLGRRSRRSHVRPFFFFWKEKNDSDLWDLIANRLEKPCLLNRRRVLMHGKKKKKKEEEGRRRSKGFERKNFFLLFCFCLAGVGFFFVKKEKQDCYWLCV